MVKVASLEKIPEVESIITTIEIARKLGEGDKFYIVPHTGGAMFKLKENEPLTVNNKTQDVKTFSENMHHILHIASHILDGTEEDINNKYSSESIDAVRNKFIDESFRSRFFVGTTSKCYLFQEVDITVSSKIATSDIVINPAVPYLTIWLHLLESLNGERKKILIDMDIPTFRLFVKQINEINEKLENYVK